MVMIHDCILINQTWTPYSQPANTHPKISPKNKGLEDALFFFYDSIFSFWETNHHFNVDISLTCKFSSPRWANQTGLFLAATHLFTLRVP